MQSKELAKKLGNYAHGGHADMHGRRSPQWKGQKAFALFFAHYLENVIDFSSQEKYDFWRIEPHLPQIAVDAFETLRISEDVKIASFRQMYKDETGREVPNITDLGASNMLDQGSAVQTTLGFMLKDILGHENDWVGYELKAYANAQMHVLQQTFDKFLRLVFRRGMYDLISSCKVRGMCGDFGETELRTYELAGRLMFTFARRIDKTKEGYYKEAGEIYCNEWSVSFIAEDGDPLGYSAGLQSVRADFRTALDMIEDVIQHWPEDVEMQQLRFAASDKVSII